MTANERVLLFVETTHQIAVFFLLFTNILIRLFLV